MEQNEQLCQLDDACAAREKNGVAKNSVIAAVGLTLMKIIVGLMTGSLGILAEAAHSALDLMAALVTWFAVHASSKAADKEHPYGHGKIENLAALFETFLLLITCGWIIYEACNRIFGKGEHEITLSVWAFLVMFISIIVDITRSRMLYRAAHKHNSQALEADALHFSTDVWSSMVVLFGLFMVWISKMVPSLDWLREADSVAALFVALIVISVSIRLGMRTVAALLDSSPEGVEQKLAACIEAMDGVVSCHRIRVRTSGPKMFIDAHVCMHGSLTLAAAHELMDKIESAIQKDHPHADVTIHPEPSEHSEK
ncbi:cation transporter [Candidatus Sumerlaeota bacterium]|nr:cation transporter [Candidatus Sumerlaeota bacterium]